MWCSEAWLASDTSLSASLPTQRKAKRRGEQSNMGRVKQRADISALEIDPTLSWSSVGGQDRHVKVLSPRTYRSTMLSVLSPGVA